MGTLIECSISDPNDAGLNVVKMYWSTSNIPPDWSTVGTSWDSPYTTTVPAGETGDLYILIYAKDNLGYETITTFYFIRTTTENTIPPDGFLILMIIIILGIVGISLCLWLVRKNKKKEVFF